MAAAPVSPERAAIDQARALIAALQVTDETVEQRAQVLLALDDLWEAYETKTTSNVLDLFEALKQSLAKSSAGHAPVSTSKAIERAECAQGATE